MKLDLVDSTLNLTHEQDSVYKKATLFVCYH